MGYILVFDLWMDILELLAFAIARMVLIENANFHPEDYLAQLISQAAKTLVWGQRLV